MNFYIVQVIRVGRRNRQIIRGEVTGVPSRTTAKQIMEALSVAGAAPSEAGAEWANYVIKSPVKAADAERTGPVQTWAWADLANPAPRQLNVRIPASLYAQVEATVAAEGVPVREWVERVLTAAVNPTPIAPQEHD